VRQRFEKYRRRLQGLVEGGGFGGMGEGLYGGRGHGVAIAATNDAIKLGRGIQRRRPHYKYAAHGRNDRCAYDIVD